jgi:hypothetical protein
VFGLVSCTDKDRIPKGVLGKEKMQQVLWDMIQAERYREIFIVDSSKNLKTETFKLYAQVFELNKITKDEFVKSYKFYMSRPDIAKDMFDSLATQANRRREELNKPKPLDTAKAKSPPPPTPVTTPAVDSSKTVKPGQAPTQPVILPMPPNDPLSRMRNRNLPPRKLRVSDTLLHLKTKP